MTDREKKALRVMLAEQRVVCDRKSGRRRGADPKHSAEETGPLLLKGRPERFLLRASKWSTGDTCPGCDSDRMTFTAESSEYGQARPYDESSREMIHGVLSCPVCGWFDDLAFCYPYQVPPEAIVDAGAEPHICPACGFFETTARHNDYCLAADLSRRAE